MTWFTALAGLAIKSSAAMAAAWIVTRLLHSRSAAARRLVWTAAATAVLALPVLSISLPSITAPAGPLDAGLRLATISVAPAAPSATQAPQPAGAPARSRPSAPLPGWREAIALLWAAGSLTGLAQLSVAVRTMRRLRRAATPSAHRALAAGLARSLGIRRPVDVLDSADGTMPMTVGLFRPAILLPAVASGWSEDQLRMSLLHELAHVRSGDVGAQLAERLALILHWWNPLAWIAWRAFVEERERAADDLVLSFGVRASDYAGHLLSVASALNAAPFGAVAMARRSQLEGRLAGSLDSRVIRGAAGHAAAAVAVLAGVAIVAPLAALRAQESATPALAADVDATIRTAVAQKNHDALEKAAAQFQSLGEYDNARKLLDSAVAIRSSVSGAQSASYGAGLLELADLENRRNRLPEADALYNRALSVLGDRPEAAPALISLGFHATEPAAALELFRKAKGLDPALTGPALTWMATVLERDGKPDEADEAYRSALATPQPAAEVVNTTLLYGRFLQSQSRGDEAKEMLQRAAALQKALLDRAATPPGSSALRVGAGVTAPSVARKVEPQYTPEARFAKYSGSVVVYVEVGPDGLAHNIGVTRGIGLGLDESAVSAIRQWRFKPGTKDGMPVTVAANIEVNFRLL